MTGKAVQRVMLIVVLLAIAHSIKPFSLRNLTLHAVHSAPSFSFVMPGSMRSGVENANQLALAMGHGWHLFETRSLSEIEADWPIENYNVVATANVSAEKLAVYEKSIEPVSQCSTKKVRASEGEKMAAKRQSESVAEKDVRETVKGLIASNLLKADSGLETISLPDIKNLAPVAIPLVLQTRFPHSQCESSELKNAANSVTKAVRAATAIQAIQSDGLDEKNTAPKPVKIAARHIAQGVKVMIANVTAKRVFVNCSTSFNTQSGLQINFKCT